MTPYPTFVDHMRTVHGPNWAVGRRAPAGAKTFSQAEFDEVKRRWAIGHPSYQLVLSLPDCAERDLICEAVLHQLGARPNAI